MKKIFYTLLGIILLISLVLIFRPKGIEVEAVTIKRGEFTETLQSEAKIRSQKRQTVYAFASGSIQSLKYKAGDFVRKQNIVTVLEWDRIRQVTAPFDGVITRVFRESAGPINRGDPIFEVSSLDDLEVVAELLTPDAVRLAKDGDALVINWGGEGSLSAKIKSISKAGDIKLSALGVQEERTEVRLGLNKFPEGIKEKFGDNYHVDVVFIISKQDNALKLPLGAIFKDGSSWAVYVIEKNHAQLRKVEIGLRNDRDVTVIKGIDAGERVILFPGDKIHSGILVKELPQK